jgi:hypothetical protein
MFCGDNEQKWVELVGRCFEKKGKHLDRISYQYQLVSAVCCLLHRAIGKYQNQWYADQCDRSEYYETQASSIFSWIDLGDGSFIIHRSEIVTVTIVAEMCRDPSTASAEAPRGVLIHRVCSGRRQTHLVLFVVFGLSSTSSATLADSTRVLREQSFAAV